MDVENKYGVLTIQEGLLELLKRFDALCQEKGIVYSLDSGTLLGAIRHHGFIPWDDDVDIVVDRYNYELLVKSFSDSNDFVFFTDLWMPRIQLRGGDYTMANAPTLDVFIFDPAPDSPILRKLKVFLIYCCQALMKKPTTKKLSLTNIRLWVGHVLGLPFTYETKLKWYSILSQLPHKKTRYCSCYNYWPSSCISILFNSNVLDSIERQSFENIELNVVRDYDHYLTKLYGDYMTPPKEEDRKPSHLGENTIRHF